jgi:hypothetical protein
MKMPNGKGNRSVTDKVKKREKKKQKRKAARKLTKQQCHQHHIEEENNKLSQDTSPQPNQPQQQPLLQPEALLEKTVKQNAKLHQQKKYIDHLKTKIRELKEPDLCTNLLNSFRGRLMVHLAKVPADLRNERVKDYKDTKPVDLFFRTMCDYED